MEQYKKQLPGLLNTKYPDDVNLQRLGTLPQLKEMLSEEVYEFDKQNAWEYFDKIYNGEPAATNKNNVLSYYLIGKAPPPNETYHKYNEGDFPDVDSDYLPESRDLIKRYLKSKWGEYNCVSVATYNVAALKAAIQDVSRVKGIPPAEYNAVTKTIAYNIADDEEGVPHDLDWACETFPSLGEYIKKYPDVGNVLDTILGTIRNTSIHASATIISSASTFERIPLIRTSDGDIIAAVPESAHTKGLQPQGFIKFDILGLNHLSIFNDANQAVTKKLGTPLDWEMILLKEYEDPEVFKIANKLLLNGIFQMEGNVPQMIIQTIKPSSLIELAAVNALIRPGCLQAKAHETYKRHKDGKFDRAAYPVYQDLRQYNIDETFFKSLADTHGVILYQEQIMLMAAKLGDLSEEETNKLRKMFNIAKKKEEHYSFIAKAKEKYLKNAEKKLPVKLAEQWWDCSAANASYTFNASHCVAYSILSFKELYLKSHHPLEFFWALLKNTDANKGTAETGTTVADSKLKNFMQEARKFGIQTLPPDVNRSDTEFSIASDHELIFGLAQIKGVGHVAAQDIIARRPYTNFEDFLEKHSPHKKPEGFVSSKANSRVIEHLILAGAFSQFGGKNELLEKFWHHKNPPKKARKKKEVAAAKEQIEHQLTMAMEGALGDSVAQAEISQMMEGMEQVPQLITPIPIPEPEVFKPLSIFELMDRERELLNVVFSEEAIIQVPWDCKSFENLLNGSKGGYMSIYGCIKGSSKKKTKSGIDYTLLKITDYKYDLYVYVWREKQNDVTHLAEGDFVKLKVNVNDSKRISYVDLLKVEKGKEQALQEKMK